MVNSVFSTITSAQLVEVVQVVTPSPTAAGAQTWWIRWWWWLCFKSRMVEAGNTPPVSPPQGSNAWRKPIKTWPTSSIVLEQVVVVLEQLEQLDKSSSKLVELEVWWCIYSNNKLQDHLDQWVHKLFRWWRRWWSLVTQVVQQDGGGGGLLLAELEEQVEMVRFWRTWSFYEQQQDQQTQVVEVVVEQAELDPSWCTGGNGGSGIVIIRYKFQ